MAQQNGRRTASRNDATLSLPSERIRGGVIALSGIFLGVCVVFLAAVLTASAPQLDRGLLDATELFAGAIPVLATAFLLSLFQGAGRLGVIFFGAGALITIGGIAVALAHIDVTASAVFFISLVVCVFVVFVVVTLTRFTSTAADQPKMETAATTSTDTGSAEYLEAP